jgi:hypothetical protein
VHPSFARRHRFPERERVIDDIATWAAADEARRDELMRSRSVNESRRSVMTGEKID